MSAGPAQALHAQSQEWSLKDFLKHQPTKFNDNTSLNLIDQMDEGNRKNFDAKGCPNASRHVIMQLTLFSIGILMFFYVKDFKIIILNEFSFNFV